MTDNNEQMKELQRQLEELKAQQANTRVNNPVTNQQAVMVRQTASGMEQGVAAIAGLLTAGPLGALASWGVIRGLQGKWTPWFVLGIPAAPILGLVQLGLIGGMTLPALNDYIEENNNNTSESTLVQPSNTDVKSPSEFLQRNYTATEAVVESTKYPQTCFSSVYPGSTGNDNKSFGCSVTNPEEGVVVVKWDDGVTTRFTDYTSAKDTVLNVGSGHLDGGNVDYTSFDGKRYFRFISDKGGESWVPTDTFNF